MRRLLDEIARAGASEARVLITGESGVGKELVARALHRASPRSQGPFIEVNGAAIPEELIESELFGHVKGSFTGAIDDRKGKWEQADSGTLFLDEIGDMSPRTQAKILRAIQDGRITRVGGARTFATDVRIVAATNRDLPAMIRAGTFREDLYFRLAVVPLRVAPLSERPEDVPLLVTHFAERLARRRGRRPKAFEPEALEALAKRRWPGNVRELQNLVERVLLMSPGPAVRAVDLPPEDGPAAGRGPSRPASDEVPAHATLAEAREAFEKRYLSRVLAETKGNVSRAAERLGLDRTTLHRKMKALGLDGSKSLSPNARDARSSREPFEQLVLEHLGAGVGLEPQVVLRRRQERGLRNEAHDLRAHDRDTVARGLGFHGLEDAVERGLLEVRHVDRNLHLAARVELHAHRLHEAIAAREVADGPRDAVGDREIRRPEVDVVCDERGAGAHDGGAARRVRGPRAEVRDPRRLRHLRREALELSLADVREVLAVR